MRLETPFVARLQARILGLAMLLGVFGFAERARGAEVHVAVAANFAGPLRVLASAFESQTGHRVVMSSGATGMLFAQISHGAPFELLLAADTKTPQALERAGLAVLDTRFTYAFGKLVLWSPKPGRVDAHGAILKSGHFGHLAIANPTLAPYGAAASEVLAHLGLLERLGPKLVRGENIAQTLQFVESGNAELGFVALSQIAVPGAAARGSYWLVPDHLYSPIRQDAVLLARGRDQPAARALLAYLASEGARAIIRSFGYGLEPLAAKAAPAAQ